MTARRAMIERAGTALPVTTRCQLLGLGRSTFYYRSEPVGDADRALMRLIDEAHLKHPYYGSRRLRDWLEDQGERVNRKKVQRLMQQMGLRALYPRHRTSQPAPGHTIYPYLLRELDITRPNQVWATDITYLPMAHGFLYLVAVMDWHSRKVLSCRLSNSLDSEFCVDALEEALRRYGTPKSSTPTRAPSLRARRSPTC